VTPRLRPLWLLAPLAAVACHGSSSTAGADAGSALPPAPAVDVVVLRDGDDFSVAVARAANPCILYPESMFDATMCPVEVQPMSSPPPRPGRSRLIALGLVRFVDQTETRAGQLTVTMNGMDRPREPTQASADAFAASMVSSLLKSVPGASLGSALPSTRLMTTDAGLHVARISFELGRMAEDRPKLEHTVSFTVWSTAGAYTFSLTAERQYATVMDAVAEQMATTLKVAHPAPPAQ
jgi:hypothetical protein